MQSSLPNRTKLKSTFSQKMSIHFILSKTMAALWLTTIFLTQGILFSLAFQSKPKLDLASKLSRDSQTLSLASDDFGLIVHKKPKAVLQPTSINDIVDLIKLSNSLPTPFPIACRGQAHSVNGQAMTNASGVVVNMTSLSVFRNGSGIVVSDYGKYVDAGGEQVWIDVLNATLKHGLTPLSWTDYLDLSVGGTLSNAGVSGQAFKFGPEISNVLELDVITGTGDLVTCSPEKNSDVFYAVLGGLGQFGVITRARIPLGPAPTRVKWVHLLYSNFTAFSEDQEHLISFNDRNDPNAPSFVEGSLLLNHPPLDLSFYPTSDQPRVNSLVTQYGIIYILELVQYYDNTSQSQVDQQVGNLVKGLKYEATFMFERDETYLGFLNRVHENEVALRAQGLWDVPHPWMNLFVPRSRILDFDEGVFKNIILRRNISVGNIIVYPMNRTKWDDRMSAVTPDEDIFYGVSVLVSSGFDNVNEFLDQKQQILQFCKDAGIKVKEYIPIHQTQQEWMEHFGPKWKIIQDRKAKFDPKKILSPGQRVFN